MNHYFFLTDTLGHKCEDQIVVGTPKEIATARILGLFDMNKMEMVAIDDGDIITTAKLFIENILQPSQTFCQIFMVSSMFNANSMKHIELPAVIQFGSGGDIPVNIKEFFVKCETKEEKYSAVANIYQQVVRSISQFPRQNHRILQCK